MTNSNIFKFFLQVFHYFKCQATGQCGSRLRISIFHKLVCGHLARLASKSQQKHKKPATTSVPRIRLKSTIQMTVNL